MDKVFITLVEPNGHEFTFLRDELMAFHKRTLRLCDPETEKNKQVAVMVLYFKNKAEFTLDVSPEDVRNALEEPEKSEEERYFTRLKRTEEVTTENESEGFITSDAEFEVRLTEVSGQVGWGPGAGSIASHNWEWNNHSGNQTYLP